MRYAIGIYTHTPYKVLIKLREAREFLVEKSLQSISQSDSTKTIFTLRGEATTYYEPFAQIIYQAINLLRLKLTERLRKTQTLFFKKNVM